MRISPMIAAAVLLGSSSASAQLFTPEVVGSSGEFYNSAAIQLSWTIGEPVITTLREGSLTMTQGFHQPTEESAIVASAPTSGDAEHNAVLYPNPFRNQLYLRAPSDWTFFDVEIVNSLGETVIGRQRVDREKYAIDFSNLPSGSYIARIWVKDSVNPLIYHVTRVE